MVRNRTKRERGEETERSRYWRGMMSARERSGLAQAEFCRRKGLSGAAFAWWPRRFKNDLAVAHAMIRDLLKALQERNRDVETLRQQVERLRRYL